MTTFILADAMSLTRFPFRPGLFLAGHTLPSHTFPYANVRFSCHLLSCFRHAYQCVSPGAQAFVISKRGLAKFVSSAVPIEMTWDAQYIRKHSLNAFCGWPKIADRVDQWHQWNTYV